MLALIKQIFKYIWISGSYWLVPLFIFILLFGGMLLMAEGSIVAPFIYAIF